MSSALSHSYWTLKRPHMLSLREPGVLKRHAHPPGGHVRRKGASGMRWWGTSEKGGRSVGMAPAQLRASRRGQAFRLGLPKVFLNIQSYWVATRFTNLRFRGIFESFCFVLPIAPRSHAASQTRKWVKMCCRSRVRVRSTDSLMKKFSSKVAKRSGSCDPTGD